MGILPFLVQWAYILSISWRPSSVTLLPSRPRASPWALLDDFRAFAEDDIEKFLPQVCNILIERSEIYPYFHANHCISL